MIMAGIFYEQFLLAIIKNKASPKIDGAFYIQLLLKK